MQVASRNFKYAGEIVGTPKSSGKHEEQNRAQRTHMTFQMLTRCRQQAVSCRYEVLVLNTCCCIYWLRVPVRCQRASPQKGETTSKLTSAAPRHTTAILEPPHSPPKEGPGKQPAVWFTLAREQTQRGKASCLLEQCHISRTWQHFDELNAAKQSRTSKVSGRWNLQTKPARHQTRQNQGA